MRDLWKREIPTKRATCPVMKVTVLYMIMLGLCFRSVRCLASGKMRICALYNGLNRVRVTNTVSLRRLRLESVLAFGLGIEGVGSFRILLSACEISAYNPHPWRTLP